MTGLVMSILKKLGIAPPFSDDELLDASIEDAMYDHKQMVDRLTSEGDNRRASNDRLRIALQIAKMRTSVFADFEDAVKERGSEVEGEGNGNAS